VIPNGVDLGPDPASARGDGRTAVFCGAMDYLPNIDAVCFFHDEVLPLVRTEIPDLRFRIVGSNPAPEVRRLASVDVEVTGRVPDVRPCLVSAAVSVAPLRLGRGVPNKVLEALALALPVVATPNATQGLDLSGFGGVEVAADAPGLAAAVVRRVRAARDGNGRFPGNRALLAGRYSWERHGEALRALVLGGRA
jgi:glycosyltransferase involved in cell wall biosynthesis